MRCQSVNASAVWAEVNITDLSSAPDAIKTECGYLEKLVF